MVYSGAVSQPPLLNPRILKEQVGLWHRECGKRLSARRRALNVSQGELADKIGVKQATISRFETGKLAPGDDLRYSIAVALACEVVDIWAPHPAAAVFDIARASRWG